MKNENYASGVQGRALPGLETLANVIECLRADARYVDEEGEATNRLEDLLQALRGTSSAQACRAKQTGPDLWTCNCGGPPCVPNGVGGNDGR